MVVFKSLAVNVLSVLEVRKLPYLLRGTEGKPSKDRNNHSNSFRLCSSAHERAGNTLNQNDSERGEEGNSTLLQEIKSLILSP